MGVVSIIVYRADFNVHSGCKPSTQTLFSSFLVVGFRGERAVDQRLVVAIQHSLSVLEFEEQAKSTNDEGKGWVN